MPRQRTASIQQMYLLLQLMEENGGDIVGSKRLTGIRGQLQISNFWKKVANRLNSCARVGDGVIKHPDQWRRYWHEIKYRVKKRASELKERHMKSMVVKELSETENRVLGIISSTLCSTENNPSAQVAIDLPMSPPQEDHPSPPPSPDPMMPTQEASSAACEVEVQITTEPESHDNKTELTTAERARRYREKLKKQNPEKYVAFRQRELERLRSCQKIITEFSDDKKIERRQLWREQKRDERRRKEMNVHRVWSHTSTPQANVKPMRGIWYHVKQNNSLQSGLVEPDPGGEDHQDNEVTETTADGSDQEEVTEADVLDSLMDTSPVAPGPGGARGTRPPRVTRGAGGARRAPPPAPPAPPAAAPRQRSALSRQRADEIHDLQKQLLLEQIREARARADLAEFKLNSLTDPL